MSNDTSLAPATIVNVSRNGKPIRCMFNPKEYTFTRQNNWAPAKTKGKSVQPLQFGGAQPATLQMQLFFDTYAEGKDVRKAYTDAIWELMWLDPKLEDKKTKVRKPPVVRFQWGQSWSFEAVITSITQKFTLFTAHGLPVRATLDVTFMQARDEKFYTEQRQNPTSGGEGAQRVWTVQDGDTLAWIAYQEYGDSSMWRSIADANGLTRVRRLVPGAVLLIPNG
jgi:nucleoid-associated protein YgaU